MPPQPMIVDGWLLTVVSCGPGAYSNGCWHAGMLCIDKVIPPLVTKLPCWLAVCHCLHVPASCVCHYVMHYQAVPVRVRALWCLLSVCVSNSCAACSVMRVGVWRNSQTPAR